MQPPAMNPGLSQSPNDAFIFHAVLRGAVKQDVDIDIRPHMADVEELNKKALNGGLETSKMPLYVLPHIVKNYVVLSSGVAAPGGAADLGGNYRDLSLFLEDSF